MPGAILDAGGHVIARMKEGISLDFEDGPDRGWLPDGSRMSWLNAPSGRKEDRLPVRVTEHNAVMPAGDGQARSPRPAPSSPPCSITGPAPADAVREAYLTRWSAPETTFGEDKTAITGAGNRTSGPVPRSGSPRLVIQEAWAWLTAAQLARASAAAALRSEAAQARALRRKDAAPATADEESFTAVVRHMIRSMTTAQVTATSSLDAIAAAAEAAARALQDQDRQEEEQPAHAGPRIVEPRATPAATRGFRACPHTTGKQTSVPAQNTNTSIPQKA